MEYLSLFKSWQWVFIIKKIIELRKLVYRIFDLVMPLVMCGSGMGGGEDVVNFTIYWICLCYNTKVRECFNYSGEVVIHILHIVYLNIGKTLLEKVFMVWLRKYFKVLATCEAQARFFKFFILFFPTNNGYLNPVEGGWCFKFQSCIEI